MTSRSLSAPAFCKNRSAISFRTFRWVALLIAVFTALSAKAGDQRVLKGHVPPADALAKPVGRLPETNSLRFAITLPLRGQADLTAFLQRLYDPNSGDYHHYLTPAQFTEKFGPTIEDYQNVIQFAKSNGLEIVKARDSRVVLDVRGKVSDVENAFHVALRTYQHPTESRQFYAPETEPTVDANLPMFNVVGLSDYAMPRPMFHKKPADAKPISASGSQTDGYYIGSDFRNAYAPGVSLTGTGQMVGLLELDGYYDADITNYEFQASLPNVPLINVNADDYTGPPGSGDPEVSLDIEMAIAMAPGLSAVVVFQAGSTTGTTGFLDILEDMVASNQIKQFSSSWGFTGGSELSDGFDAEFQSMATKGQSFYQASGDGDAWYNPIWAPADSPYLTSVGGTELTMNGAGVSYNSETVWNEGNLGRRNGWSPNGNGYWGSGGGISGVYSIPTWQTNAINTTNQGSTSFRNIPDVSLTADDIWVVYDGGDSGAFGGTSCAAPLWAAFTALINQQAVSNGVASAGFINPAIYALGQGSSYNSAFHDITTGNNINASSHSLWSANTGYDLCTGWGSPNGAGLINALSVTPLAITPGSGFISTGPFGGPFSVTNQSFTLSNGGSSSLNWSIVNTTLWLTASSSNGVLAANAAATVNVGLNSAAASLAPGGYTNFVLFSNTVAGASASRQFSLTVTKLAPAVSWTNPASVVYGPALSSIQLDASANVPGSFVYSPSAGTVLTAGTHTLSVAFTPSNSADYTSATNTASLVVTPAPLSATASNAARVYGTANPAFTGSIVGVVNGDNITASFNSSATTNSPVGAYSIVPSLVDPNDRETNYTVSLTNGTLTVTIATPVLNWNTPSPITYGAALGSNQLDATANTSGSYSYTPASGTVLTAGTNLLSVHFTPANTTDYTNANDSVNLVVLPAPLTVKASNVTQAYGQPIPTLTGAITGVTNGDNITATYSLTVTTNSPPGQYAIVPSLVDPNDRQTNYNVTLSNGTFTVTMATPIVSWSAPAPVIYGAALGSNQLDATANVPGNFNYTPAAGSVLPPGSNSLFVLFTPSDATDYSNASNSVVLVVSLVPISLNINLVGSNVVLTWNDPDSVFTLQAAPTITGAFTNVPNATNPYTNAIACAQQYFRLIAPASP